LNNPVFLTLFANTVFENYVELRWRPVFSSTLLSLT
jgi:hypothetical protein